MILLLKPTQHYIIVQDQSPVLSQPCDIKPDRSDKLYAQRSARFMLDKTLASGKNQINFQWNILFIFNSFNFQELIFANVCDVLLRKKIKIYT